MDKQLIERIALEEARQQSSKAGVEFIGVEFIERFSHSFLARIDAERGQEPAGLFYATPDQTRWIQSTGEPHEYPVHKLYATPVACPQCAEKDEMIRKQQALIDAGTQVTGSAQKRADALQAKVAEFQEQRDSAYEIARHHLEKREEAQAKVAELEKEVEAAKSAARYHATQTNEVNVVVAEQSAEIERLTLARADDLAVDEAELAAQKTIITQQAERIAELEETRDALWETQKALCNQINDRDKLIEKCEKALSSAAEWGAPMRDAPKSSRPEWFDKANSTLAAITAHKKGS